MRHLAFAAFLGIGLGVALGCDGLTSSPTVVCAGTGFAAIRAEVRRTDGRPIAAGATLVVSDGAFTQTVVQPDGLLSLAAAENRTGTYTVEVSKPFYETRRIAGVVVAGDRCGAKHTVTVPVVLQALPSAPSIRSVTIAQPVGGTSVGLHTQYSVWVDATPGTDTSVLWSVSGPRLATIDQTGDLTAICGSQTDGLVIATARQDSTLRGTAILRVSGNACP